MDKPWDLSNEENWKNDLVIVQAKVSQLIGLYDRDTQVLRRAMHYIANLRIAGDGQGRVQAGMDGPFILPYEVVSPATIRLEHAEYTYLQVSEQPKEYREMLENLYLEGLNNIKRSREATPIIELPRNIDVDAILSPRKKR